MSQRRQDRVAALILRELSLLLQRKVHDPRVRGVHIVSVHVSPDFHLARVNYSTLDEHQDIDKVQQGLDSAKAFLRMELKPALQMKVLPELAFFFDSSIRRGDKILELLRGIRPPDAPPDAPAKE